MWGILYENEGEKFQLFGEFKGFPYNFPIQKHSLDIPDDKLSCESVANNKGQVLVLKPADAKENVQSSHQHFKIEREEGTSSSSNLNPAVLTCTESHLRINDVKLKKGQRRILKHRDLIELEEPQKLLKFFDERQNYRIVRKQFSSEVRSQFYISKKLGSGYCGTVRLAHDVKTFNKFAIKTIRYDLESDEEMVEKEIDNEIRILKKLDHPNVVKLVKTYRDIDRVHLLTEYMNAGDLMQMIKKSKRKHLYESTAKFVMFQVMQGLQHLHQHNIVHLDIKLENVFVRLEREIYIYKIGDFGFSECQDNIESYNGTAEYYPPEVFRDNPNGYSGKKRDMWSLGVFLYVCLTGRYPFQGSGHTLSARIKSGEYQIDRNVGQMISSEAKNLIGKLIVVEPDERLTADEVLKHSWFNNEQLNLRLERFKRAFNISYSKEEVAEQPEEESRQKRQRIR